jgi:hypothetical protein
MKKVKILVLVLLVGCTKEMKVRNLSILPGMPSVTKKSLLVSTKSSATIRIYRDNGRNQYLIDSATVYIGTGFQDTLKTLYAHNFNSLAFVRNGADYYAIGITNYVDSLPFIIMEPTLAYYTMKISTYNTPTGLFLFDGAGFALSSTDITPTYTPLANAVTKYSFSDQKDFGVSLSNRFALVYKPSMP